MMRYGSVCSGIEAASVAWHPLGWHPAFFSEIEAFPRAVLKHRWPGVPLHGDFTTIGADDYGPIDLLVGGTPCQSFSIAGLRGGLDDERGNLALEYLRLADRKRPRWLVWENVPGVLSSNGGRDFGAILGGMAELGYGFAWRVLDAQYVRVDGHPRAVPQRRRRVFLVGYLGDWRPAAAVLSERESLRRDPPPRREAGQGTARGATSCAAVSSGQGWWAESLTGATLRAQDSVTKADTLIASTGDVAHCLNAGAMGRIDYETETMIAHALRGEGFDASEDGPGRGAPVVPWALNMQGGKGSGGWACNIAPTLGADTQAHSVATAYAVRRLTPRECERLQAFPDDYTAIPYRGKPADLCPDGPRYKALGNSMAVNVMRWIGQRIQTVEGIMAAQRRAAE